MRNQHCLFGLRGLVAGLCVVGVARFAGAQDLYAPGEYGFDLPQAVGPQSMSTPAMGSATAAVANDRLYGAYTAYYSHPWYGYAGGAYSGYAPSAYGNSGVYSAGYPFGGYYGYPNGYALSGIHSTPYPYVSPARFYRVPYGYSYPGLPPRIGYRGYYPHPLMNGYGGYYGFPNGYGYGYWGAFW